MICEICKSEGKKSIIKILDESTLTILGRGEAYYDEEGELHDHSKISWTMKYKCSNGHGIDKSRTSIECCARGCEQNTGRMGNSANRTAAQMGDSS